MTTFEPVAERVPVEDGADGASFVSAVGPVIG
jgi:hypothetical protein